MRFLELSGGVPRHPDAVAEQVVQGLATGGFLGPGLCIQRRERSSVTFSCSAAFLNNVPEYGEIDVVATDNGSRVDCRLVCRGMAFRSLFLAGLVAAALGLALGFATSSPLAGAAIAVPTWMVGGFGGWALGLIRLRGRAQAFIRNAKYLKTL